MTAYGYVRISTGHQETRLQIDALNKAGVYRLFIEKTSGRLDHSSRPELKSCMNLLKPGDSLVVWRLDRLGRSVIDLLNISKELEARKVSICSLTETIDTSTASGRLLFQLLALLAEFERNLIRERTIAGLEAARRRGIIGGRRSIIPKEAHLTVFKAYKSGSSIEALAKEFNVSKRTIYNYLNLAKLAT